MLGAVFITRDINEKRRLAAAAILALASFVASGAGARAQTEAACAAPTGQAVQIVSVDIHLEPRLADGRKLRLRGIEPPRGTPTNVHLAEQARAFLAAAIEGKTLAALAGEPDRWGRFPAGLASPDGFQHHQHLSGEMIAQGWARADLLDMPAECAGDFLRLEKDARDAGRGLWADPAYAIIDAGKLHGFVGLGGKTIIAEGVVTSTGQWRTLTFLNFGRTRNDPSAALSRPVVQALERKGVQVRELRGKRVRLRGQLQLRQSPRIEIFTAASLEIVPAIATPSLSRRN